MITRRRAMFGASLFALTLAACQTETSSAGLRKPDIMLIVLDDVGFSDFGAFGSEIRTPNIDALAAGGLRFNHFDTKAICSATRASLLTGQNCQTVRMAELVSQLKAPDPDDTSKTKGEIPADIRMLPSALRDAGYATLAVGKWHLAPLYEQDGKGSLASWPLQRGFDYFYGFLNGWTDQFQPDLAENNKVLGVRSPSAGYHLSEDLVDHAIAAMTRVREQDAAQPVFLYLALGANHAPIQAPKAYIERYRGAYDRGWDQLRLDRFARQKAAGIIPSDTVLPPINPGDRKWADLTDQERRVFARFMEAYAGFLEHADAQIGRLVDHLKSTGAYDNTLIVVLSDNGAAGEAGQTGSFDKPYGGRMSIQEMDDHLDALGSAASQPLYQRPWAMASVTPLRRYKVWPYAGGVRTPLIVSWPNRIRDAGAIRQQFVDVIDIAPTLASLAKTSLSSGREGEPAGRSIEAVLWDGAASSPRNVQYFEMRGNRAITAGGWRAVAMHRPGTDFDADKWELFNLGTDFSESTDLSARHPEKVKALEALWWEEARRYASPPLAEMSERAAALNRYADAFLDPPD